MNLEDRLALVRQVGEEIVTEEELRALLEAKPHPVAYDGFEPSGKIHIAQGLLRAINVNKMTRAGARFKMFVADWHAWANNKMGGDLAKIQTTGKYIVETWKACGMDLANVDFAWASEFVADEGYWKKVMNVARESSLDRVLRTTQIMGRSEKDKLSAAQILYPCMQAADIFHLGADITQLGMDQRKVNMLAREVGPKLGFWKPVVVSHHMLMGLQQPPPVVDRPKLVDQYYAPLAKRLDGFRSIMPPAVMGDYSGWVDKVREIATAASRLEALAAAPEHAQLVNEHSRDEIGTVLKQVDMGLFEKYQQSRANRTDIRKTDLRANLLVDFRDAVAKTKRSGDAARMEATEQMMAMELWSALHDEVEAANKQFQEKLSMAALERATAMKMSKSNPDSAIFMTDAAADVERKLRKAYCPEKSAHENPVLEYAKYIVFERFPSVTVERPERFGGTVTFHGYAELEAAFVAGKLHPADLKKLVGASINELLGPVRRHFELDAGARALKDQVDAFQVTR